MDIGSFVQENRRWLLGCALTLVVFFIARGVIGSIYDPTGDRMRARSIVNGVRAEETYDSDALAAATKEQQELVAARQLLEAELAYVPDAAFRFEGKGLSPDEFLGKVGRERKLAIRRAASERDVEVADGDLSWPPAPQGVDEIRAVLFGIELVDATCSRLFEAHDSVRQQDPRAEGLLSMRVGVEQRRASRRTPRMPGRPGQAPDFDPGDHFDQQRVSFEFRCDEATAATFLSSLRRPGKTLTLEAGLNVTQSGRRGDPLQVKGSLIGIAFKYDQKEPQ